MTRNEMLRTVVALACETESRTDNEQRALIALAWECDCEHNKLTSTNRARRKADFEMWDLVSLVDSTRYLDEGDADIPMPKNWNDRWARWVRESPTIEPPQRARPRAHT